MIDAPLSDDVMLLMLVAARLLGLGLCAPVLGRRELPMRYRVALALCLALATWPMIARFPWTPLSSGGELAIGLGIELLTGAAMGLGVRALFWGAMYAGQLIGQMCGLQWGQAYDPSSDEGDGPLAHLFWWTSLTLFVVVGGLGQLVVSTLDSFRVLPAGSLELSEKPIDFLLTMTGQSFQIGLRVGIAALVALLLSMLFVGLIHRVNSRLNALQTGFTAHLVLGLIVAAVVCTQAPWKVVRQVQVALAAFTQSAPPELRIPQGRAGLPALPPQGW